MNRRTFLATALAGAAATVARPAPVRAAGGLQLTDDIRRHLAALTPIRGAVDPATAFDGTPLLISFWASWCPPCNAEFGEMRDFIAAHGPDQVRIVAVNWLESTYSGATVEDLQNYARRFIDPSIAVVSGSDQIGRDFGGVPLIPAVFLFDGDGTEIFSVQAQGGHGTTFMRARDLETGLGLVG